MRSDPTPLVILLEQDDPQLLPGLCRAADLDGPPEAMVGLPDPQYAPCANPANDFRLCRAHRALIGVMDDEDPTEDPHEGDRYDTRDDR